MKKTSIKIIILALIILAAFFYYSNRQTKIEIKNVSFNEPNVVIEVANSEVVNKENSVSDKLEFVANIPSSSASVLISTSTNLKNQSTSSKSSSTSLDIISTSSKNINNNNLNKATTTINIKVPFTTQAPLVNWADSRQQDGCEEAVAIMAMAWVKDEGLNPKKLISKSEFENRIIELSDFEKENYGEYRDVNINDMAAWIFNDYFSYDKVSVKSLKDEKDIIKELEESNIVLLPMDGRKLKNPNFKAPGPLTHMILIKGYDYETKEFITNDPGTRNGENYRYLEKNILNAIKVYPTGYHEDYIGTAKVMLVVEK